MAYNTILERPWFAIPGARKKLHEKIADRRGGSVRSDRSLTPGTFQRAQFDGPDCIMNRVYETRGRCRQKAAAHLDIGLTKFDELVADGRMPQPRVIDARVIWDVYELDAAFDRLPRRGEGVVHLPATIDNPWNRLAV